MPKIMQDFKISNIKKHDFQYLLGFIQVPRSLKKFKISKISLRFHHVVFRSTPSETVLVCLPHGSRLVLGCQLMQWMLIAHGLPSLAILSWSDTDCISSRPPAHFRLPFGKAPWKRDGLQSTEIPDHSCPPSSLVSVTRVVGCRGGSRYVEGYGDSLTWK